MKYLVSVISLYHLCLVSCTNAQVDVKQKTMDQFEYSPKTAHPNANKLMTEDFYWSSIEETGPFGSDDGWDAAYSFREWRISNKTGSPLIFLKQLIAKWDYPYFDWNEMDTNTIKKFIVSRTEMDEATIQQQIQLLKDVSKNHPDSSMKNTDDNKLREIVLVSASGMGQIFLLGQDNAIIATGFAQFALEGKIDSDIKILTTTAIKRQLLPVLLDRYDEKYRVKRKDQLTKMLEVVAKMNY